MLEIRLLGRFCVRRGGEEIPAGAFHGRMARTLVRILLTRRGQFVSRDVLADALWPRQLPAAPEMNVNVLVNRARRALGDPSLILTGPGGYAFSADDRCIVDAEAFLARVEAGRSVLAVGQELAALREFRAALGLWGGEPLAEDVYEDWAQAYRDRLARAHLEALEGAAAAALALRDPAQAVALAEVAVAEEPLRETAHLLLARALAMGGDKASALQALNRLGRRFADELGLDPSAEAHELGARIAGGDTLGPLPGRPVIPIQNPEPAFVGRDDEMEAVLGALGAWPPRAVLVSGGMGTGKSRLLAEVEACSPAPVVVARAYPAGQDRAWSLAGALLRGALAVVPDAARAVPERTAQALADAVADLDHLAPTARLPLDPESQRTLALEGAVRLLEAVAPHAILSVDDLQWSDATTLDLLSYALSRVSDLRLVLAYRPEDVDRREPLASFLANLPALPAEPVAVRILPLSPMAIGYLVNHEEVAQAIVEETDRTPLAVTEVFRALAGQGMVELDARGRWRARTAAAAELARDAARTGHREALRARLRRQSPRRGELVSLLVLLGREAPARLLCAATAADPPAVWEDLDGLAKAGLVRLEETGWTVGHDSVAESVLEWLEPSERGRLHDMLAGALQGEDADPAELARHLAGAGDAPAAAEKFAEAGQQSLDRFTHDEAEQLSEAGLRLSREPRSRARLLEIRAEARAHRGDVGGARDDLRAAVALRRLGPERSRTFTRMATLVSGTEDYGNAGQLIELALLEAGSDVSARAEALVLGAILDFNTGQLERAESRSVEALALFERVGDAKGVARAMDSRAMSSFARGCLREAVELLERVTSLFWDSGQLLRATNPLAIRGVALAFMGRPEEGLDEVERSLHLERMFGRPEGEAFSLGCRGVVKRVAGRFEEAESDIEEALAIAERLGHREFITACHYALGTVYAAARDLDRAEASLRRSLDLARDLPLWSSYASGWLASVLVTRGDLVAAATYVNRAFAEGPPITHYEARVAQAELAFARGDGDAREIAVTALELARAGGHLVSAVRLQELLSS